MPTTGGSGQSVRIGKSGLPMKKLANGTWVEQAAPPAKKAAVIKRPTPTATSQPAVVPRPTGMPYAPPTLSARPPGMPYATPNAGITASSVPNPTGASMPAGVPNAAPGGPVVTPGGASPGMRAASVPDPGTGVPGASTDLDKALYGFASSWDPTLLNYLYANPEQFIKQLMLNKGQDPEGGNSGLYTATTPYADALMSVLPLAFGGGGPPDASSGINWMGSQLQQGMKPGGAGLDFTQVLDALRSQTTQQGSAAQTYYNGPGMDPMDQYNMAKQTILGAASVGLPPQFQAAMKNQMAQAFDSYMTKFLTGKESGNFLPYFLDPKNNYTRGY